MLKKLHASLSVIVLVLSITSNARAQGANLSGAWQLTVDGKPRTSVLTLTQSGNTVYGTLAMRGERGKIQNDQIEEGKLVGNTLTFSFMHEQVRHHATALISGNSMKLDITGKSDDQVFHATASR